MRGETLRYLDNNATTRVDPDVFEKMKPFFCDLYGNPSSVYGFGAQVHDYLEQARTNVARLIGVADAQQVIFTSCGSESDNSAVFLATQALPDRKRIVTTSVEHLAILDTCRTLSAKGYDVVEIGVDSDGRLDMEAFEAAVDENTCLVTIMHANNETGVLFPVRDCASIAKSKGALFHTDAVQTAGKVPINLDGTPEVDMLSLSGHKFHAPKGIGALFVRKGVPYEKFLKGGHQERNRRAGTEATAAIVGLGEAARIASEYLDDEDTRVRGLRDKLQEGILASIPEARVNGAEPRTPNTLSVAFRGATEDAMLKLLDDRGICASSGSACHSEVIDPSHVMMAMDVPEDYLVGVLRFSLSRFTTDDDIDAVLEVLPDVVESARAQSIVFDD